MEKNELKIELYPDSVPRYSFDKSSLKDSIPSNVLVHSFDIKQELAYIESNVPVLNGFYTAHTNHYPIRIKPDDIWLLIIQAFSNHVNANSEKLRKLFVNFDGKKELRINYPLSSIEEVNRKDLENFSEQINNQMKEFLGEELLETLTPNFTTTDYDSSIVCKITIMGTFKKYFDYTMGLCGCGIPYIILEGTAEDYEKILSKSIKLKKYDFDWYIDKIIPHIKKMVEAKKGNIDTDYFKNMIQKKEVTEKIYGLSGISKGKAKVEYLCGWFLNFFAYDKEGYKFEDEVLKVKEFDELANQMQIIPFKIQDEVHNKEYLLKYEVGFLGCDQNEKKEVFPVQGWYVSRNTKKEEEDDEWMY